MLPDPSLRRIERTAIVACLAMTGVAYLVDEDPRVALGVLGGGLLSAVSYRTIGSGVAGLTAALAGDPPPERARERPRVGGWALAKAALRYALLAILAYVMMARLRLHPLGLLAGASSVVVAVSVEALRVLLKKS